MGGGKGLTVGSKQYTVNHKHLIVLIIISILLISFVAVTIATGFFGINTTKVSSLEKGLVGHWMLDAENGAKDLTPYGNHGTGQGGVTIGGAEDRKGKSGGATNFDGVDDVISADLTYGDDYTVSVWLKPSSLDIIEDYGRTIIASSPSKTYPIWFLVRGTKFRVYTYSPSTSSFEESNYDNLSVGVWVNLVVSATKGGESKIYINGVLDKSFIAGNTISQNYISIGDLRPDRKIAFKGSISDVRIYNRALSEDEIKLLFNSYKPIASTSDLNKGLVGHWMLDAENGAKDLTPYGNHGIAQGGITIGGVEDRKGKSNGATSFDGSNDYINYGNVNGLTGSFTISVWVKMNSFGSYSTFVSKGTSGSWFSNNYVLSTYGNKVRFKGTFSNSIELDSQTILSTNTWYHIVGVYNQELQKANIYIDGVKDTKENTNCKNPTTVTNNLVIGGGNTYYSDGSISDVRIYNRALSEDEIKLLFDSYKPKEASVGNLNKGLILDMPLTTKWMKSSTIVSDRTPYGNDGTLMNGVNITNEGAVFDGVNDYITSDNQIINTLDDGTISFYTRVLSYSPTATAFLTKRITTGGGDPSLFVFIYGQKVAIDYGKHAGVYRWTTSYIMPLNELKHITITRKSGTGMKLYIDGTLMDTTTIENVPLDSIGPSLLYIGRDSTSSQYYLNGQLSNIKIWNRELSNEEVKLLYEKGRW
ncbi:MAG: LamG domain-containing protein [Candidatus Pacearchaeota archaeon]